MATKRSSKRPKSSKTLAHHASKAAKTAGGSHAVWIGALAVVAAGAVGTAIFLSTRKASATPSTTPTPGTPAVPGAPGTPGTPGTPGVPAPTVVPGPTPAQLPQTGDVYASLSSAQQTAVQNALYAYIVQGYGNCPNVFPNGMNDIISQGITSASTLSQATLRQIAVDCYQQANNVGQTIGAGTLDVQTYQKLMGL
jgi:hypothetical protein